MVFRDGILGGKSALITGGGTGIGASIAQELARAGADVAVASRDPAHLEESRRAIEALGRRAVAIACDVRDAEAVERLFAQVKARLGGLDVLVNNAAGNFLCPADKLSPNGFRSVVEIDLVGSFLCSRAAFPLLCERGGGTIINITATLGSQGVPLQVHAGSAKAGIDAMTRQLASEWGPRGIRVVAIAPGPIGDTEGMRRLAGGRDEEIARSIPLRRLGRREEIAWLAVYLASDAAAWITGATVVVDGGQRLRASF
ncbi:MAG: SDR family oxidoreductase [Planctomycetes bacterium]|nr:SDR family oxidoreductase [Planctomycetota bacterium]